MRIDTRTRLILFCVALCMGAWAPVFAGSVKDEVKANAKQTRSEIEASKKALKASGQQIKEEAAQMGKDIKAGFKKAFTKSGHKEKEMADREKEGGHGKK